MPYCCGLTEYEQVLDDLSSTYTTVQCLARDRAKRREHGGG